MYNPASRVLSLLEMLQSRGTVSAGELSERLEVEQRTVRRYITALRDLGVPVESTPGRGGGYHLGPGSKLPPLMFSDEEALAVVLSLLRTLSGGPGADAADAASALAKINRVLPRDMRTGTSALGESAAFTGSALALSQQDAVETDHRTILSVATARHLRQRLSISYRTPGGVETERKIDPYGLVQHRSAWYVAGWCHLRADARVFRLDRIVALTIRRETFDLPEGFDAREEVTRALASAPYRWRVEVLIEASPDDVRPFIPEGVAIIEPASGGARIIARSNGLDRVARFIASLGYRFEIIEPLELHDVVRQIGRELLGIAGPAAPIDCRDLSG